MKKVAIITDSNSGITMEEAKELGIRVIPMPFYINEVLYQEGISLTRDKFYEYMREDSEISTSQPTPADVLDVWNETLKESDEVVYIPMSSGLSSSCQTAKLLAEDFEDKVFVVDNQRISVTMRRSVLDALELAAQGKSGKEISDILMREKLNASIYITLDTLKYLKKGGRITPAAAAIGTVLHLKPVLQIQGEKLDAYAKSRGLKNAKKLMLDAMEHDLTVRFAGEKMHLFTAYTCSEEEGEAWTEEVRAHFPGYEVHSDPLSLSVACHIGEGSIAIACCREVPELA